MAKQSKDFKEQFKIDRTDINNGLDVLIPSSPAPAPAPKQTRTGAYRGQRTDTDDGRTAVSFKLPTDTIEQLKKLCFHDRRPQWWVVNEGIKMMVAKYESEHGELPSMPE